jgi:uncharacterized protein YjbI with pentapeptide repeats
MNQDFSGQNLRGYNFKGQDLAKANFSGADIRGANFTNASLQGANFTQAIAGLDSKMGNVFVILSLILLILLGFVSAVGGAYVIKCLDTNFLDLSFQLHLTAIVASILGASFSILIVRQGAILAAGVLVIEIIVGAFIASLLATISTLNRELVFAKVVSEIIAAGLAPPAALAAIAFTGALALVVLTAVTSKNLAVAVSLLGWAGAFISAIIIAVVAAGEDAIIGAGAIALAGGILSIYLGRRTLAGDKQQALIKNIATSITTYCGTSFRQANLTEADFTQANLENTDFQAAILTRTCWYQAKHLDFAKLEDTYLKDALKRDLLVSGIGINCNFDYQDFRGLNLAQANLENASLIHTVLYEANLENANLSAAKLVRTQLEQANLTGANLTGACIQDWAIAKSTKLDRVICKHVFMKLVDGYPRDQRPVHGEFEEGEFKIFASSILDTIELYHEGDINPVAAVIVLKGLADKYNESFQVTGLERTDNGAVILKMKTLQVVNPDLIQAEYYQNYPEVFTLTMQDPDRVLPPDIQANAELLDQKVRNPTNNINININIWNSTVNGGLNAIQGNNNNQIITNDISNLVGEPYQIEAFLNEKIKNILDRPQLTTDDKTQMILQVFQEYEKEFLPENRLRN